jgi:segregation and condensation protein B
MRVRIVPPGARRDPPVPDESGASQAPGAFEDGEVPRAADASDGSGAIDAVDETDELEALYRRALETLEQAEEQVASAFEDLALDELEVVEEDPESAGDEPPGPHGALVADDEADATADDSAEVDGEEGRPTRLRLRQIVEAALFVGGTAITSKRLCALLHGEFDLDRIETTLAELDAHYAAQGRPYEIAFGEGGWRLALRPEYERLRDRVYGLGPKEVRLSQEALEVLAFVAYRQPVARSDFERTGRPNAGSVLNQLLRRELIVLERGAGKQEIRYRTAPRFLELFGLRHLDDLPRAADVAFK